MTKKSRKKSTASANSQEGQAQTVPDALGDGVHELETRLTQFIMSSVQDIHNSIGEQKSKIETTMEKFGEGVLQNSQLLDQIIGKLGENQEKLVEIGSEQKEMREKIDRVTCSFAERFPQLIGTSHPRPPNAQIYPRTEPRHVNPNSIPIGTFSKYTPITEMNLNEPPPKFERLPQKPNFAYPPPNELKPTSSVPKFIARPTTFSSSDEED